MIASLFLSANLGFITGVTLASFNIPKYVLLILFLRFKKYKTILIFIIFALLGSWRYEIYRNQALKIDLTKYNGHKVTLYGIVSEEIDPGGNYQKVTVKVNKVNGELTNGSVLVSLNKYPELNYGDNLELIGNLTAPNNFSDFKYDRYLARYDICSVMAFPKIRIVSQSRDFYFYLLVLKKNVYELINKALPEPEAGLANALLLGYKGTLDTKEKTSFSCCGLSHIVAISGSHLTLLSALAFDFLLIFGWSRRRSFRPVVIFLWFYTILTGLQASALRSAIMGHLTLWGEKYGRKDASGRLLFLAAALMLFFNPFLLRDDLGFELSFLAMFALVYVCPLGEKILGRGSLKSLIILTLASQLLTWPISALNFGRFSVIAPLANLLVVWIFAWLLPALLCGMVLSLVFPALKILWFAPSYFMLRYVNLMGDWLATWPKACFDLTISWQLVLAYYFVLVIVYFMLNKKHPLSAG